MGDHAGARDARTLSAEEVARTLTPDEPDTSVTLRPAVPRTTSLPAFGERYLPIGELGRGGMGRVDEVLDTVLGRPVARKTLLDNTSVKRVETLVAEAQTCAQLEHPSIVPVYDL